MTELAKRKEPAPLLIQVSFTNVMVVSLRPNTIAWSVLRMVPATLKALGAVATKPPAKCMSSDSTPPNCTVPVLAKVTALIKATLARKIKLNGCAATVNVGVVKPPLNAMVCCVSLKTTLVAVVTGPMKVVNSLFTTSRVFNALVSPTAPSTLIAAILPPSSFKLRAPAVSPSMVLAKVN